MEILDLTAPFTYKKTKTQDEVACLWSYSWLEAVWEEQSRILFFKAT